MDGSHPYNTKGGWGWGLVQDSSCLPLISSFPRKEIAARKVRSAFSVDVRYPFCVLSSSSKWVAVYAATSCFHFGLRWTSNANSMLEAELHLSSILARQIQTTSSGI